MEIKYKKIFQDLPQYNGSKVVGNVTAVGGPLITARLPFATVGDVCHIQTQQTNILAQVISFKDSTVKLAPLDIPTGVYLGAKVINTGLPLTIYPPHNLVGKVIDVLGKELKFNDSPLEHSKKNEPTRMIFVNNKAPEALSRPPINKQLLTGVKCIDAFCPIGYGQRIGLLAGPGVGKSTTLGIIAANAKVDLTIIALVGERSREVPDFINETLGVEGLKKAIVVVATSDESAARRALAPLTATALAEHFRDQGKNVLLLVDSLTRTARALREVGLAAGEIPVRQGFPASVYAELPRILERAGTNQKGSITGIYTVLTQNDQSQDALGEELKSLLDGHIVLDPTIAERGILPAFDITTSISRLQNRLLSKDELNDLKTVRAAASSLKHNKDILLFGGTPDPELQAALAIEKDINDFICQAPQEDIAVNISKEIGILANNYRKSLYKNMQQV